MSFDSSNEGALGETPTTPGESGRPGPVARRADMRRGLAILALGFFGCMALSLWAMEVSTPKPAPAPAPPTKVGVAGFPSNLEPVRLLEPARALSVRPYFRGFVAEGVDRQGRIDADKQGRLRLFFQSSSGLGPQPPRKGGTLPSRSYCGKQEVVVDARGLGAKPDQAKTKCPAKDPRELKLPKACSLADVLKVAATRRAPIDATTKIEYYDAYRGPAYRYTARGVERFVLSADDCKSIFLGKDVRGSVP